MSDLRWRNSRVFWQLCYDSQHLFISSRNESLINLLTEVLFMIGSTTLQFINPLFYQGFMIVIWERLWFFFLLALATTVLAGCYTTRNSVHHKITIWPHNLDTPALNLTEGNQNIAEYTGDVLPLTGICMNHCQSRTSNQAPTFHQRVVWDGNPIFYENMYIVLYS